VAASSRPRVRVKFCGITRPQDALHAAQLGADAIGLIFYPPSPRAVDIARALEVMAAVPAMVTTVGVFVNPQPDELAALLEQVPLDLVQFHGDESPAVCQSSSRPWIKALGMREGTDVRDMATRYAGARGLLLDTFSAEQKGGTGRTFDWQLIPSDLDVPLVLAGGLDVTNVAAAIRAVRPHAVDANGGVESMPGIKDHKKMEAFMREVNGG
jgi:phosphoribosylanthranilate isomerase